MAKIDHEYNKDYAQVIKRQVRELSSLAEMNKKIHSTMNIDRLLQILVEQAVTGKMKELSTLFEMSGVLNKSLRVDEVLKLILSLVKGLGFSMSAVPHVGRR